MFGTGLFAPIYQRFIARDSHATAMRDAGTGEIRERLINIEAKIDAAASANHAPNHSFETELRNRFQYLPNTDLAKRRICELTQLLTPCSARSFSKIRLGNAHDGGYV